MTVAAYDEALAALDGVGLTQKQVDLLLREAPARRDGVTEARVRLLMGEEDSAIAIAVNLDAVERRRLVHHIATKWKGADSVWHVLFAICERHPSDLPMLEYALESWSDASRVMPFTWWDAIKEGKYQAYHQLVRNFAIAGEDVAVLLTPGVEKSLGGIRLLGVRDVSARDLLGILKLTWLTRVRRLELRSFELSSKVGVALGRTRAFPEVTLLEVGGIRCQPAALADLLVGDSFSSLETLKLSSIEAVRRNRVVYPESVTDNPLPVDQLMEAVGERELARPPYGLELKGLGVDASAVLAMVAAPCIRELVGLSLLFSVITAREMSILSRASLALETFALHIGKIGPEGAKCLSSAPWLKTLRHLSLPNQNLSDSGFASVLQNLAGVEVLELRHNSLGPRTATLLARMDLSALRRLELSHNHFLDSDLAKILRNASLTGLTHLHAHGTGASLETARALMDGAHLACLETVELGDEVGDEAAAVLEGAPLPKLKRLQLRGVSNEAIGPLQRAGSFVTNRRFA